MAQLIPSLPDFLVRFQKAIHGPDGAKILALVQKGRVDLLRGLILELLRVEDIQDLLTFLRDEGASRRGPPSREDERSVPPGPMPVDRRRWNPHSGTRRPGADLGSEDLNGFHQSSSPISGFFRGIPSICEIFF